MAVHLSEDRKDSQKHFNSKLCKRKGEILWTGQAANSLYDMKLVGLNLNCLEAGFTFHFSLKKTYNHNVP